ncbi:MAG: MerR family transcriptional regulator [Candidatus Omnitrophota bacterium]
MESAALNNNLYLVKDLSRLSGLSVYTVKYYLKLGLIREIGRSPETNFRYFNNSTVDSLKRIIGLRKEKVSLNKIRYLMDEKGSS